MELGSRERIVFLLRVRRLERGDRKRVFLSVDGVFLHGRDAVPAAGQSRRTFIISTFLSPSIAGQEFLPIFFPGNHLWMTFAIGYRTLKYISTNSMEVCTRKFGAMQQMPALNTVDCHVDRSVRRRPRSGLQRDLNQKQVICPEPRRVAVVPPADEMYKSCCRLQSNSMVKDEGEPCHEILDIFLRKNGYGDQAIANGSRPFFCGSPPVRADNPLVHDVKFVKKDIPSPPVNLSQKSSCGASFGTKPSVRIEGFACSNSEKHCIVPALA